MILLDLYAHPGQWSLPFLLLQEREPYQNISHRGMPTWEDHCAFVRSRPHAAWYFFASETGAQAGCVYLSHQREIGVAVLVAQRGKGLATQAIQALMELHPGRFLANINPSNAPSLALFRRLGFQGPIQLTLERASHD
jgi:RimJ/RimL family protein N-acetyltransferase